MQRSRTALSYFALVALVSSAALLFVVQARALRDSAARTVGAYFEAGDEMRVIELAPGGPAERAGVRIGDLLVAVDGQPIATFVDYDRVAAGFEPGEPIVYRVLRTPPAGSVAGEAREIAIMPGVPTPWGLLAVNGFVALVCLGLAFLTVAQHRAGRRPQLLGIFLSLLALELVLPYDAVGNPWIVLGAWSSYWLLSGTIYAVGLHLASLIPSRPRWLRRRPWAVPAVYLTMIGMGALTGVTYVLENGVEQLELPWSSLLLERVMDRWLGPIWALATLVLLGEPAIRHRDRRRRLQAGLVLLGLLPQVFYILLDRALGIAGATAPLWMDTFYALIVLAFPVAVFAAIFRYHLFDIELVVRRGLVYTVLTTILLLVFYALLGIGGALFSQMLENDRPSLWVASAATLILGLLFNPLRHALQQLIDRQLFPERRARRQRLIELVRELPARGTLTAMGEHLVVRLEKIFAVRSATLLLADPRTRLLSTAASTHTDLDDSGTVTLLFAPQDPGIEHLRRLSRPVTTADLTQRSPAFGRRLAALGAALAVPLQSRESLVGVLLLGGGRDRDAFRAEDLELLDFLARHLATVFENVRLFRSATYESLTGLLRREAILELLAAELRRAERYGRPLTVAFADLDHFKEVNDRFGHLAGDAVLKRVAEKLSGSLRSTDAIGRYGGEEFLLVFPETRLEDAKVVAEKIRHTVEELAFRSADEAPIEVRISIGLATIDGESARDGRSLDELLAAADGALYRAKAAGRNRIETALAAIS